MMRVPLADGEQLRTSAWAKAKTPTSAVCVLTGCITNRISDRKRKQCIRNAKFSPNAEADEVDPGEQVVSSHKDSDVGHSNVLEKEIDLV